MSEVHEHRAMVVDEGHRRDAASCTRSVPDDAIDADGCAGASKETARNDQGTMPDRLLPIQKLVDALH